MTNNTNLQGNMLIPPNGNYLTQNNEEQRYVYVDVTKLIQGILHACKEMFEYGYMAGELSNVKSRADEDDKREISDIVSE